jgi:cytochrome c peroxidase
MRRTTVPAWISALALIAAACGSSETPAPTPAEPTPPAAVRTTARALFGTLPGEAESAVNPVTEPKIELGRMLYYDPRLSLSQEVACNSCHQLDNFGVDSEPTSPGHRGQRGGRNSPTVYNAAFHLAQFWDGRAADVEEQAKGPILNPIEMAMPGEAEVIALLRSIPGYPPLFARAFPGDDEALSYDNLARAIGAFERRLVTPGPFDRFLAGDDSALDAGALAGLSKFMEVGCPTCHNGPTVGGLLYQKLGLVRPYETGDQGRFELTGKEVDRFVFKVPSLRNIARTGPYFHDGSITSLNQAIRLMSAHQLGRDLSEDDVASIRRFLDSLTGEPDATYAARPELPASGPDTPGPSS